MGSSMFYPQIYLPLEVNLWDASQNPSRVIFRRPLASWMCQKKSELEGAVDFYPQNYLVSGGQSMGCIDKSFEGDIQEVNGYLCAKNQRNRRGR